MKRQYRVRTNAQFQEIRRRGRSVSSDMLVLYRLPNQLPYSRFGFSINGRMGNAVARNRMKRRLRAIVNLQLDALQIGWDILLIARRPLRSANYQQMESACARLFQRAQLLNTAINPAVGSSAGVKTLLMRKLVLAVIRFYQHYISPGLGANCRFYPTCSHYTYQAIEKYGVVKGGWMGFKRIIRCNPWNRGGFDPVP